MYALPNLPIRDSFWNSQAVLAQVQATGSTTRQRLPGIASLQNFRTDQAAAFSPQSVAPLLQQQSGGTATTNAFASGNFGGLGNFQIQAFPREVAGPVPLNQGSIPISILNQIIANRDTAALALSRARNYHPDQNPGSGPA